MGFFSFNSEFEISVKHPKEEAYSRFYDYVVNKGNLTISNYKQCDMLAFTKATSLFSYPIDFEIFFNEAENNQTTLIVKSSSGTIDWGKAKRIIGEIADIIY